VANVTVEFLAQGDYALIC